MLYNTPAIYTPLNYNPYDTTKYKYMTTDEDGNCVEVNSQKLTYVQMLDLCYEYYWQQKDRIIFTEARNLMALSTTKKGSALIGKDVKIEELSDEDIIKTIVSIKLKGTYQYFTKSPFSYDVDCNGAVDVKDLSMVKKYLIGSEELTPGQQLVASNEDTFEPDIRTVTKISQKIVGLE